MSEQLIKAVYEYHYTWTDIIGSGMFYAFALGFIYIWRTTRKK